MLSSAALGNHSLLLVEMALAVHRLFGRGGQRRVVLLVEVVQLALLRLGAEEVLANLEAEVVDLVLGVHGRGHREDLVELLESKSECQLCLGSIPFSGANSPLGLGKEEEDEQPQDRAPRRVPRKRALRLERVE